MEAEFEGLDVNMDRQLGKILAQALDEEQLGQLAMVGIDVGLQVARDQDAANHVDSGDVGRCDFLPGFGFSRFGIYHDQFSRGDTRVLNQ